MEQSQLSIVFGCLGQMTRLEILKLLAPMSKGKDPKGLPAGQIASTLGVAPPTLSFHLKDMTLRNVLLQKRMGREIYYMANLPLILGALEILVIQME